MNGQIGFARAQSSNGVGVCRLAALKRGLPYWQPAAPDQRKLSDAGRACLRGFPGLMRKSCSGSVMR